MIQAKKIDKLQLWLRHRRVLVVVSAFLFEPIAHNRTIKTEEKAKVVASDWRGKCVQFLAALAALHETIKIKG